MYEKKGLSNNNEYAIASEPRWRFVGQQFHSPSKGVTVIQ